MDLRELAGMAEATRQEWPVKLADLIVEIHKTVQISKVDGKMVLPARRRS